MSGKKAGSTDQAWHVGYWDDSGNRSLIHGRLKIRPDGSFTITDADGLVFAAQGGCDLIALRAKPLRVAVMTGEARPAEPAAAAGVGTS